MFTTDEEILARVGCHDNCFQEEIARYCQEDDNNQLENGRPTTGGNQERRRGEKEEERVTTSSYIYDKPHPHKMVCAKGKLYMCIIISNMRT